MSIEGTWASRGYGWILQIGPEGYALFDHTRLACVEFERGDKSQIATAFDRICQDDPDHLSLHVRGEISRYDFDRIDSLPASCQSVDAARLPDPLLNFDAFCEFFRQDYAFFELRGVDWETSCSEMRSSIRPDTSPEELFKHLARLISELQDNHVILENGSSTAVSERIAEIKDLMVRQFDLKSPTIGDPDTIAKLQPFVSREFLKRNSKSAGNGAITWGFVEPGIGYVNVLKLFGLADTPASRNASNLPPHRDDHARMLHDDLAALESILDHVMADLGDSKAILLDIRINGGGFDCLGMSIANRFCEEKRLAFSKEARDGDGLTEKQNFYLQPNGKPAFTKPVYVLTSARTASAGEVLALCMHALPHVTVVGEPTTGILSDNLAKHLPNGWITSLSNEIYQAAGGGVYECCGVPVDVEVPVFQAKEFAAGFHRAIDTSMQLALAASA